MMEKNHEEEKMMSSKIMMTSNQSNSNVRETQDFCDLFSTTISSLAMDAEALKQLTSLKLAMEMDIRGRTLTKYEDKENHNKDGTVNANPNTFSSEYDRIEDRQVKRNASNGIVYQIMKIDTLVTELEKKMCILGGIVEEEKQSLVDLENVRCAAKAQNEVLQDMLAFCDNTLTQKNTETEHLHLRHDRKSISKSRASSTPNNATREKRPQSHEMRKKAGVTPSNFNAYTQISIPRVTDEEMKSLSRNIRGRIHLAVVNEAVEEIEKVCRDKYKAISHKQGKGTAKHLSLNLEQNRRNQVSSHRELEVAEHDDRPWVAETSLRQACAFFRSGESTARAILTILRTLTRLKQIPAKHSQVTYVVLSDQMERL